MWKIRKKPRALTAAAFVIASTCAQAANLSWNWASPSPTGADLKGVTYGGGSAGAAKYVAVGGVNATIPMAAGKGVILVSSDAGATWSAPAWPGTPSLLSSVAWNGTNTFVAVGDKGTIATSTDGGATWTLASLAGNPDLNSVTWSATSSTFVAVGGTSAGTAGVVYTAADGKTWTPQTFSGIHPLNSVACGSTMCAAVDNGATSTVYKSMTPAGVTWSSVSIPALSKELFNIIANGNNFIAVGQSSGGVSQGVAFDGTSWSVFDPLGGMAARDLFAVTHVGSQYLAVGTYGLNDNATIALAANDAMPTTWASKLDTSGIPRPLFALTHGPAGETKVIAVGDHGLIARSDRTAGTDAATSWSYLQAGQGDQKVLAMTWYSKAGSSKFIAVGENGLYETSPDGALWKNVAPSPLGTAESHGILYDPVKDQLIVVGVGGSGAKSTNGGGMWTTITSAMTGTLNDLNGIAADPVSGLYVIVGKSKTLVISNDGGATWTADTTSLAGLPGGTDLSSIAWNPQTHEFVVVGTSGVGSLALGAVTGTGAGATIAWTIPTIPSV
ncbi:MAG TPA: hypothetical protein VF132_13710 [Rudaea sp.]